MNITPTPETDAEESTVDDNKVVPADFARKLERELHFAIANAMIVGLEIDKLTEHIANLQHLNDNQRIQLVNLQNECALNNQTSQTWDRLSLEAELTQLRKVCDELAHIAEWNRNRTEPDVIKIISNYSTLQHVIKAKECRHNNFHYNTFNNKVCSDCGISDEAVKEKENK